VVQEEISMARKPKHEVRLQMHDLCDVVEEHTRWLWEGRFPAGQLSVVSGDPETNKSYMLLDLVHRIVEGRPHPDTGKNPEVQGNALWVTGEDSPGEVKRRSGNLNYKGEGIFVAEGIFRTKDPTNIDLARDMDILEEATEKTESKVVIFDPITAFEPRLDGNCDNEVRGLVLQPLTNLAHNTGAGVIFVKHFNKNPNLPIQYRIGGSVAYTNTPRAAWEVKTLSKRTGKRLLRKIKMNVYPCADPLTFWIAKDGQVEYEAYTGTLEDGEPVPNPKRRGRPAHVPKAKAIWEEFLSEGPTSSARAFGFAKAAGITSKIMDQARRELGIRMISVDGEKLWTFPQENDA